MAKNSINMKTIIVFVNGIFYQQISYRNQAIAKKQFYLFSKKGIMDPNTGEVIENATFELV